MVDWLSFVAMASGAGNSPEPDDSHFSIPIITQLTHIAGQGNKKKTTKKDTKTKEFSHFQCDQIQH